MMPELSNRVLVTIHVNKEVQIPLNSVIRIATPDLLGSPQVEILFSEEQGYIQKGDTIWGTITPGVLDGLNGLGDVVSNVDTIMIAAKNLMTSDAMDSLTAAIADFHSITQNIDNILKQNSSKVNVAMSDLQSFASMLRENNDKITNTIEKLSTVSDNMAEAEIKEAIDSLSMVVGRVHMFVDNVNEGKGTLGQLVVNDSLYASLNNSLISLDRLLEDLKANPKKYINVTVFGRKEKK